MHRQWLIRKKLSHALLGIFKTHAVQRTDDAPYQIRVLRNVCRHNKTPCPDLRHVQKDSATKTSPQVRTRKKKSVQVSYHVYATIARDVNVVKRTCKGTELCMVLLARKKCTIRFRDNAGALLKKNNYGFQCTTLGAESVTFNSSERCFFWKILFSFSTTIESKESNRHAWYSPVTKFALLQKMKPNRQDTIETWSVFTHKSKFEQGSLRYIGLAGIISRYLSFANNQYRPQ